MGYRQRSCSRVTSRSNEPYFRRGVHFVPSPAADSDGKHDFGKDLLLAFGLNRDQVLETIHRSTHLAIDRSLYFLFFSGFDDELSAVVLFDWDVFLGNLVVRSCLGTARTDRYPDSRC